VLVTRNSIGPLLLKTKLRRLLRRSPQIAYREFLETFLNRGHVIALMLAVGGTWFAIKNASISERLQEANDWAYALQAFVLVAVVWGILCIIRAPYIAWHRDRQNGCWFGPIFVYHEAQLVKTIHCDGASDEQRFSFILDDVEPDSFVSFTVKFDASESTEIKCAVFGKYRLNLPNSIGDRQMASRIDGSRNASFYVKMPERIIDQTFRIYVDKFEIGPGRRQHEQHSN
jgi:hypothetical protein